MKKAGAGWLRRKNLKDNGLEFHFATEGAENADQSRAEQQQRSGLRRGAATTANNVECALRLVAVSIPSLAAVGGIVIVTRRTVAEVPRFPSGRGSASRTNHHPVIGASTKAKSRNVGDGGQVAAGSEVVPVAVQAGEHGQLRSRLTAVVGENTHVERIGAHDKANPNVDLADVATLRNLELVGCDKAGADGASAGYCPA